MAGRMHKPDLDKMMRGIQRLDVVNPIAWARTFEASGITVDMVREALKAEMLRRDQIGQDVLDQMMIRNRQETVDE